MRQIALDTETTGLYHETGDRLIEIGLVEIMNRKITGKVLHGYFNPERKSSAAAQVVHRIADDFLAKQPLFANFIPKLLNFIQDSELIIHNAKFDVGFLNFELLRAGYNKKLEEHSVTITDTLMIARQKFPGQRNTLDALCKRFNIDLATRQNGHGALLDAELLAKMYLALTGGQLEIISELLYTEATILKTKKAYQPTPVITATEEELDQHKKILEKMANSVWLQEKS